jgi:hypothetical protein
MTTKKTGAEEAIDEIKKMDEKATGTTEKKASTRSTKPKEEAAPAPAEDPKEKEEVTWKDVEKKGDEIIEKERAILADLDEDDVPDVPEPKKIKFITIANIPAHQRFHVRPVVKATKTQTINIETLRKLNPK